MENNIDEIKPKKRRSAPVWLQISIVIGLILALLAILATQLIRTQHPIMSVGTKVPEFTLNLFDNYTYQGSNKVSLSSLRGKVVVVNFWASWCPTCADESPAMEAAWKDYEPTNKVIFLGVDYTDVDSKALEFLARFDITYPNGPDLGTKITPLFNRNIAMPETYIIDQQGVLRYRQIGPFQSVAEIKNAIDPLLSGS